ncbi:PKD domain-containing protein [Mucilaginibacter sp. JRF]|uniref:PKD domain-containing protein n=1 Tax=Mucilaginibacter sp. JRF TaxID=2780088 RepID=UPI00187EC893|nr:PKD domain-containing protein [Mucilaginibacter sp. JRF]MBE9583623.1 PKD domain-containing protein [Mucilaginibacter sp. JRF]
MKKLFSISSAIVLIAMLSVGCKKEKNVAVDVVEEAKPTAGFTVEVPDTLDYKAFKFTSTSTNFKEILWQFGDDSTSTEEAPSHRYVFDGDYHVVLTTRNSQGYSASREIVLKVADPNFDPTKVGENYFLTIGGVLTVSRDNGAGPNGGEGSKKVVDGDVNSKFLQSGFAGDLVMRFELDTPAVAGAYTMTSANDSPDRDPKTWILAGSEDGIKWINLDSRSGINFTARFQRKLYHFNNNVAYKHYRVSIKANNGSRDFQMAEWTVNKKQPD